MCSVLGIGYVMRTVFISFINALAHEKKKSYVRMIKMQIQDDFCAFASLNLNKISL